MYAIIETGGKQYKVSVGDVIYIEKVNIVPESDVDFKVVAVQDENGFHFDNIALTSAKVIGKVLKTDRAKKITVFTYKPKKSSKRKMGHRQWYSKVQIESISL